MSGERECVYVERAKESALQKARAYVSKYLLPLRKNTVVISAKKQTNYCDFFFATPSI